MAAKKPKSKRATPKKAKAKSRTTKKAKAKSRTTRKADLASIVKSVTDKDIKSARKGAAKRKKKKSEAPEVMKPMNMLKYD